MNILDKRASNPAAALDGTELVYVAQLGADAVTTVQDIKDFATNGFLPITTAAATYQTLSGMSAYLTTSAAASTYATTSSLTSGLLANLTPTINTQTGTAYTVGTVGADNDGKTYLRMDNADANTVTITTAQTKPISVRQTGNGATTLVADAGVTLNGNLVFTAQHQTKTVIPLGSGVYDVVASPTVFSDATFRIQDNDDATKQLAFEVSGVAAGTPRTITMPNADVNLGTLPSVATSYGTLTAGQTRCQIIGGSGNTVGATAVDCILTGCTSVTAYGTRNQFNNCTNWILNATHAGTDNIFNRCTGDLTQTMYVDSIGVTYNNCTQENLYGLPMSYGSESPWTNYSTVEGSGVGGGVRITKQTATLTGQGAGAKELVASGAHGASFGVLGNNRINSGNKAYHRIQIFGGDSGGNVYRMTADRKVVISQGVIASNSTLDVDIADAGSTYTVTIAVVTGYLTVTITPDSAQNMNYIATVISEYVA